MDGDGRQRRDDDESHGGQSEPFEYVHLRGAGAKRGRLLRPVGPSHGGVVCRERHRRGGRLSVLVGVGVVEVGVGCGGVYAVGDIDDGDPGFFELAQLRGPGRCQPGQRVPGAGEGQRPGSAGRLHAVRGVGAGDQRRRAGHGDGDPDPARSGPDADRDADRPGWGRGDGHPRMAVAAAAAGSVRFVAVPDPGRGGRHGRWVDVHVHAQVNGGGAGAAGAGELFRRARPAGLRRRSR